MRTAALLFTCILATACGEQGSNQGELSPPASAGAMALPAGAPAPMLVAGAGASAQAGAAPVLPNAGAAAPAGPVAMTDPHAELQPPELEPGYTRYFTTPLEVAGGDSQDWAQWIGGPLDHDYDVIDIRGEQGFGGHHALVYATSEANAPGFTRLWKDEDQITTRLMGGLGGEGGARAILPPGVVFRVAKGSYILVQTHYLNVTDGPITGRTVLDIKLAPVDPGKRVASIMSSTKLAIELPPGKESTLDVHCVVKQDLPFLQFSNHMHEWGVSTYTEVTDPAGVSEMLKDDPQWSGDWALNPNLTAFTVEQPKIVKAGSTLHTHCKWRNDGAEAVKFPTEMCVFFGFVLRDNDVICNNGEWVETAATVPAPGEGEPTMPPVQASPGACDNASDRPISEAANFEAKSMTCATSCAFGTDVAGCNAACFVRDLGLSQGCAACNGTFMKCNVDECLSPCLIDSASAACRMCTGSKCEPAYKTCRGF